MALVAKDIGHDLLKVGAEEIGEWLGKFLLRIRHGKDFIRWLRDHVGALSPKLLSVLSFFVRVAIDPPEWLVRRCAKLFRIDVATAQRAFEEGGDRFAEVFIEGLGDLGVDLGDIEAVKTGAKKLSEEMLNHKFAIRERGDGMIEIHRIQCHELLTGKNQIGMGDRRDEPQYRDGVQEKTLAWTLDHLDMDRLAIPWCCKYELPKDVRAQILGVQAPVTTVKGPAKSEPKQEKPDLHPLAVVLDMMRLPPEGMAASHARFYENLVVQAEAIPELEGVYASIRDCATKPVWDVKSFASVLTRAIGERGLIDSTPPPAGIAVEDHRRAQVSERAKHFAIAMELHVLAHESKTIGAIMGRVFADFKGMSATAFHFLALDTDKSPTAKEIVTSLKESADRMNREADEMMMARLRKRANHFR